MATGMFSITSNPPSQMRFPPMRNNLPTMSGSSTTKTASMAGLANHAILAKIDKLRELNVGAVIPLPQVSPHPALTTSVDAKARLSSLLWETSPPVRAPFSKA